MNTNALNIEMSPALMMDIDVTAKSVGVTSENLVLGIITDFFNKNKGTGVMPERLRQLRGSLKVLNTMDLHDDMRAKAILED